MITFNSEISLKLLKIYGKITRVEINQIKKSEFSDITPNELHLIYLIGTNKNITASSIATDLNISRAALSKSLNSLEKKEFIRRKANIRNKRYMDIELTHKGEKLFSTYNRLHEELIYSFTKDLSSQEIEKLISSLYRVTNF